MTSQKQIEANRKNAHKSTGPRTPQGKARSGMNALKHGLMSCQVLLPEEDKKELETFAVRIRPVLAPVGEMELLLTDRIITAAWRLRRVLRVEVAIFNTLREYRVETNPFDILEAETETVRRNDGQIFTNISADSDAFSKLSRYESAIERSMYRALHELQRLQADRSGEDVPVPAVLDVTMDGSNAAE